MSELSYMSEISPARRPMIKIGSGQPVPIAAGGQYKNTPAPVDICFVFDTTGSMSNKINGLVSSTVDLVGDLAKLELDWRVTTVPFGDLTVPGDRIVSEMPWVTTRGAAESQLRAMPRFSGGGNSGESSIEAMEIALAKDFRTAAIKVLVLITDEPALQTHQNTASRMSLRLRQAEVICFTAAPNEPYYQEWARHCGGSWTQISGSMDNASLRALLRSLVKQVVAVANDVVQITGGSVREFLALPSRPDRSIGSGSV
jgi:hypothetical protein